MAKKSITVPVRMDQKTLRSFAMFDTFVLKKQWRRPATFGGIFLLFALICFFLTGKDQNVFMGVFLSIIGVGMPLVYVLMYLSSVSQQAQKLKLPRKVYTLVIMEDFIRITNDMKVEQPVNLNWNQIHALYRRKNAIYLYVTPQKAFILPNGQADAPVEELWQMLTTRASEAKKTKVNR